ncbi:reverse transcriptase domain-containing protein [Tanacetum coccineum]|uniref:Reverse transcriptase domain-containing protein n=1 Tax=Tanacetum coccineum TaxID=301880 RepID=A0ABQ5ENF6_9ASTR
MTKIEKSFNERPQGALPSNTIPNPKEDIKVITTRSGITLAIPLIPPVGPNNWTIGLDFGPTPPPNPPSSFKEVERDPKTTMDQVYISSSESIARVPSSIIQPAPASKSNEILERNPHQPHIPYPSRCLRNCTLISILLKLVILKKLPEKLGDHGKFLIPCDFSELEECMALADLELANRSVAYPAGIAEDVFVQVGKFTFPANFVVVDYDVDPRVPFILVRPFLRMARALVDVHEEELILRVSDEKLTFNVDSTSKYSYKHGNESINLIDIINTTCEDHFHTNAFLALDSMQPDIDNEIYDSKGDILFVEKLLDDEPSEAKKSEINPLIREPSDTFLMGDKEIKFNPLKDIDDPVSIPRVSEKPLDSLDSETFVMTISNPLFDFDYEFTSIFDNPIFDIQNEDSDESKMETIMEDVQIHS